MRSDFAADATPQRPAVHPAVATAAAYGWRILVLCGVVVVLRWLLSKLWVLVFALVVALFLSRALAAPNNWLRQRMPNALAAGLTLLGFIALLVAIGFVVGSAAGDEFSSLGPTLSSGIDAVENWLINSSPFDISRQRVDQFRAQLGDLAVEQLRSSADTLVSGAVAAAEVLGGLLLAMISTFFFLKDGRKLRNWWLALLPDRRRGVGGRMARRAWFTLGAYLRGAAMLGAVEAVVIGVTLALVGSSLVASVMVLTFASAFVPIVGAIMAGILAVLVALATASPIDALIVAGVALAVQQLDNDLLAPFVYGRALQLHPLVVLFSIVAGSALAGFAGAVLAVPLTAVTINVVNEARLPDNQTTPAPPA